MYKRIERQVRINKDRVSHLILRRQYEGIEGKYRDAKFYYLPELVMKTWWRGVSRVYPEGYYIMGIRDSMWSNNSNHQPDYTVEEVKDSKELFEVTRDAQTPSSIYTKDSVEIYCGKVLLEKHYFDDFAMAEHFCEVNFPNIKAVIK